MPDEKHVLDYSEMTQRLDLTFEVQPVVILDQRDKVLKNKVISLVSVAWDPNFLVDFIGSFRKKFEEGILIFSLTLR